MLKIFQATLKQRKHLFLIIFTLFAMLGVTFSSQVEIFTVGVLTKKGPDFFELFGPVEEGKLTYAELVDKEALDSRFSEISDKNLGGVTHRSASKWLDRKKRGDLFYKGYSFLDRIFAFTKDFRYLALLIVVVALFRAVTLFFHKLCTRILAIRINRDLRQSYFEHIQTLPLSFYQKYHMGSLSSRAVSDASLISEAINSCLTNYIQTPFTVISTLGLCFLTSWELSLVIFLGFPLVVYPILFLARRIKKIAKQLQKNQEDFASILIDFLSGIQTIKLFAMEDVSLKKYRTRNDGVARLEKRAARYDVSSRPIVHTIGMFFLGFALLWGLYVLDMSVSEVLVYCGFLYIFYEPIKKFAEENGHIQKGIAACERMQEVLSVKPEIVDAPDAVPLKGFSHSIQFDHVWFRYQDEWVLQDVSFSIEKGQKVAIVGPTGAGKSTIAHLIPRLYDIQQGHILIDGQPIHKFTQKSLREQIAFVPQKSFLFFDTIAENISFGREYSHEEIQQAAQKAHADEFISKMPKNYQTPLMEAGKNLSGGQQQRLSIARALFKQAPILIMDEATSSLDTTSEHNIKLALQELHGKITQLIIAHRLTTIQDADKIIYIDQGRKVDEGTFDELIQTCAPFRTMWNHYTNGFKDTLRTHS